MDWEYIYPNGDYSVSLKISPTSPSSHYAKVRDPDWLTRVYWDLAAEFGDLWQFDDPTFREAAEVRKLRIHVVGYRNNSLAWGKFGVFTNGSLFKTPSNTWGGYQAPGSEHYTLTLNPITGNPWTLQEIDDLKAGVYHYDSGIPSRVGTNSYFISVIYENAAVRTLKPNGYTGTAATLKGLVTNTEGAFLDPYLASSSCIRTKFQWGETQAYGSTTTIQYGVTGAFAANISGLNPTKIYHYRTVVEVDGNQYSGWDAYYGQDMLIPATDTPTRSIADRLNAIQAI